MRKNDKKAFTLIELIAVLVILAVIAIIVTPLVLNIIKSAKKSANERSIDEYGKAVELAAASYLLDTGKKANSFDVLNVEYSGNEVKCNISEVYKNNVFLSQCSVNGKEVKNAKTSDGYYHYGDATKFVDLYGDEVKKAIVRYQKDNNEMPSLLSQLSINADGLNVSCNNNRIHLDGNFYLSDCSINNIPIQDYRYGTDNYVIGDKITYNGMDFYVIENSDENKDTVTMLKAEPLTVDEVNTYGIGHVNMYATYNTSSTYQTASNQNGYGGMAYYTSTTCGYPTVGSSTMVTTGCTSDYTQSEVKYVVDAWAKDKFQSSDLKKDETGYSARLITYDELINNLGYNNATWDASYWQVNPEYTPSWVYSSNYYYWTMSQYEDSASSVWDVGYNGRLANYSVFNNYGVMRPVVNIDKSVIE